MGTSKGEKASNKPPLGPLLTDGVCLGGSPPGVGTPTALSWKLGSSWMFCFVFVLRLNRASQTYFFPIHLTDQLLPSAVFYATVGPLVAYFAMHRLVIKPYLRAQKEK